MVIGGAIEVGILARPSRRRRVGRLKADAGSRSRATRFSELGSAAASSPPPQPSPPRGGSGTRAKSRGSAASRGGRTAVRNEGLRSEARRQEQGLKLETSAQRRGRGKMVKPPGRVTPRESCPAPSTLRGGLGRGVLVSCRDQQRQQHMSQSYQSRSFPSNLPSIPFRPSRAASFFACKYCTFMLYSRVANWGERAANTDQLQRKSGVNTKRRAGFLSDSTIQGTAVPRACASLTSAIGKCTRHAPP